MAKKDDDLMKRRDVRMAGLAMILGLDSFELEDELRKAGVDPERCSPEEAAQELKRRGLTAQDRRSWWPF